jgi:hypothetical protein
MLKSRLLFALIFINTFIYSQLNSMNGEVFTPKGDLRALVIFAGFKGFDSDQDMEGWKHEAEFPEYVVNGRCPELFFTDTAEFENIPSPNNQSISRLFYDMSKNHRPFRFMADVYPSRVNIDPTKAIGWDGMNRLVIEKLKETNPTFDWSPYDNRTNNPNFKFDNSQSSPDGKPDYVIICYRYEKFWEKQPVSQMNYWMGSGGGISVLQGVHNFKFNDKYTITEDGFHMNTVGAKSTENFRRLFQHELGHELFSCPHHFGAGATQGSYFRSVTFGWGTSTSSATCTKLINSWEGWLLGWIEIKHDLADFSDNGIYYLDDFATTGEVIRIKIPNTKNQYAWIENHQLKSIFDQSRWTGSLVNEPKGSSGMTNIDTGLFIFNENVVDARENIRTSLVFDMQAINGTRFLNANGNYDYKVPTKFGKSWLEYWNNNVYEFERTDANPYDGINPFVFYRFDANKDGKIDNNHDFNMGNATESYQIVKEIVGDTGRMLYGNHGCTNSEAKGYRRKHAFDVGDTLSMCHNPPLTNLARYNYRTEEQEPIFINGLKIIVLSKEKGVYKLKIEFDNNLVSKDLRLAGNLILKDISNKEIDFWVQNESKILVNKSGTINTLKNNNGTFTNETKWKIDSASLYFSDKTELEINDSSSVLLAGNSRLEMLKSKLILKDKAVLTFEKNTHFIIDKKSRIFTEKGAKIIFLAGSYINDILLKEDYSIENTIKLKPKKLMRKVGG